MHYFQMQQVKCSGHESIYGHKATYMIIQKEKKKEEIMKQIEPTQIKRYTKATKQRQKANHQLYYVVMQ